MFLVLSATNFPAKMHIEQLARREIGIDQRRRPRFLQGFFMDNDQRCPRHRRQVKSQSGKRESAPVSVGF